MLSAAYIFLQVSREYLYLFHPDNKFCNFDVAGPANEIVNFFDQMIPKLPLHRPVVLGVIYFNAGIGVVIQIRKLFENYGSSYNILDRL